MSPEQEDRIKRRAYEIWEREGCPHGRGDVHWSMAIQEIRAEDGWVDDAADPAEPMDDLSRQLGSAEASLAPEGTSPAEAAPEEPAPARKPRARKAAAPKAETPIVETPKIEAGVVEASDPPKKARKTAATKTAATKTAAASKEVAEKPKRTTKVKA